MAIIMQKILRMRPEHSHKTFSQYCPFRQIYQFCDAVDKPIQVVANVGD